MMKHRMNICTYPSFIKLILSWNGFGSALLDDQQCTGKRSRLGAALLVSTVALKYKVLPSSTGLGTSSVKLRTKKASILKVKNTLPDRNK